MEYRFDYIKESVDKWNPSVPRDAVTIKSIIPFYILLPWVGLDDNGKVTITPAKDYYGEAIPDLEEWHRQRDEYCKKLAKEYGYE